MYDFVVVQSSSLEERKKKTLDRRISVQKKDLELEYKNQGSTRTKFRFLKSPVYLGPVFLEKPERVHALGYVFMLSALVASYLEYRVRKGLKETGQAVLLPGNKKTDRPQAQTIMEIFSLIEALISGGERYFPETMPLQAISMVEWTGYDL